MDKQGMYSNLNFNHAPTRLALQDHCRPRHHGDLHLPVAGYSPGFLVLDPVNPFGLSLLGSHLWHSKRNL